MFCFIPPTWDSFTDWLLSSSTMCWIHGKAGSGKSTLMHFISEHEKTIKCINVDLYASTAGFAGCHLTT
jgi:ABC-type molybdenum transport system ATPase subunit/photorepair protein PhrA